MALPGESDEDFAKRLQIELNRDEDVERQLQEDHLFALTVAEQIQNNSDVDEDFTCNHPLKSPTQNVRGIREDGAVYETHSDTSILQVPEIHNSSSTNNSRFENQSVSLERTAMDKYKKLETSVSSSYSHEISDSDSDTDNFEPKSSKTVHNDSLSSSLHEISESDNSDEDTCQGSSLKKSPSRSKPAMEESDDYKQDSKDKRPKCKFGKTCYRKNPKHLKAFWHPEGEHGHSSIPGTSSNEEAPPSKKQKLDQKGSDHCLKMNDRFGFYLTKVAGIDNAHNLHAVHIKDILSTSMGNLQASAQFNYMFDIPWLIQQYPVEFRSKPLLIVHGMQRETKAEYDMAAMNYSNVKLCQAKMEIMYGTHHTKMMLLLYDNGMRVVITTANNIHQDWYQKTQGVWISPLFPKLDKGEASAGDSDTHFKKDLLEYLSAYKLNGLKEWQEHIKQHNMSSAKVFILGSVPGRHLGEKKTAFGHLKLRKILQEHGPSVSEVKGWPVVGQFSSIGSMGPNKDNWLCAEWRESLSTAKGLGGLRTADAPLKLIFPTKDNIRLSLEGYPAGASVPYSIHTAKKQQFLHEYFHQWRAEVQGRSRAMPHIKTYLRMSPDSKKIAWFAVTSSNLSKAAWGALEKKQSQLMIRSYEIGVLFLPQMFGAEKFFEVQDKECQNSGEFPVPYDLPPTPYTKQDRPWLWDIPYKDLPDTHGNMWCPS
ncbi:tyrosyl-DNA phosphodiesterase 1 [Lingula anatina]|uniref:Tyrosyl-DNA phosphodiesterase 1 n=1 Tax=Lingula anatina TaxID=7574 RepID=A0A1S3I3D5_LINAN|nr:tyrosyl-DNA phosphodiesterase 1 [Lingula anatina]|eukprot:XP_013392782.1 tyrosyl-DNA phosphodiesterase 1 [Lingula anatina]